MYIFCTQTITKLSLAGKPVAEKYASSLRSFMRFHGEEDLPFFRLDEALMMSYEKWLLEKGLCRNTTSYYMRNLHAIYNRAVALNLAPYGSNPFRNVYTGIDKTVHRAISIDNIRRLYKADLSDSPEDSFARDMFMFSFCTRGMSFVDIAFLKQTNMKDDILCYDRRKTHQLMQIKSNTMMRKIIKRYSDKKSLLLFPIITGMSQDVHRQYITANQRINRHLINLGRRLGIPVKLTMYVARHSWATAARKSNIPSSIISRGMGHDSEKTTNIYLDSVDMSDVDKANEIVLKALKIKV
ncbi:MAG: site-specific integrase [Prevotella sp.]